MTRDLISALQTKEAKGTSIMGMDLVDGEYIFSGNVLAVVQSDDKTPEVVLVEGVMFYGNIGVPFRQDMPIETLKLFDKDVFEDAYKLMKSSEAAIRNAIRFKECCKKLMS